MKYNIFIKHCSIIIMTSFIFLSGCGKRITEKDIGQYIAEHPEQIIKSVANYRKSFLERRTHSHSLLVNKFSNSSNSEYWPSVNHKGKIRVIEILDYNCGYCKSAFAKIENKTAGAWNDVSFTIVALPLLSDKSRIASLLTRKAYHTNKQPLRIIQNFISIPLVDEAKAAEVASLRSISLSDIKKYEAGLDDDLKQVKELGIRGTPTFLINGKVITGFNEASLEHAIAQARAEIPNKSS